MNRKKIKKQKKEPVFIDILSDFGFKRVFADENNKDLLISLLNAILEKINVIVETKNRGSFARVSPDFLIFAQQYSEHLYITKKHFHSSIN